jgi:predicted MFS family arabinose efflux permease
MISLPGKAALILSSIFVAIGLFSMGLILPPMAAAAAHTPQAALVPWIGSIAAPAFALSSPLFGAAAEKLGYRRLYLAALIAFVLSGVAPALTDSLWLVLALRIVIGLAAAGVLAAALYGIARLPEAERAPMFGYHSLVGSLAATIMLPIVGHLAKSGWHAPFAINLIGLAVLPLVFFLPRSASDSPAAAPVHAAATPETLLGGLSPAICLFAGLVGILLFVPHIVGPFYMARIGTSDPNVQWIPLTVMSVASMIGASLYGRFQQAVGTDGVFAMVTLAIGAGLIVCGTAPSLPIFTVGTLLAGTLGICMPNLYTAALRGGASHSGRALGVMNGTIYLAPVLLPITVKPLSLHWGPGGVFLFYGMLMLAWWIWFALRWLGRRPGPASALST